jgi:GDSL-like Lipase/Acylhydrolase family/N-terminus of Esterase_SGNH_hydro-type
MKRHIITTRFASTLFFSLALAGWTAHLNAQQTKPSPAATATKAAQPDSPGEDAVAEKKEKVAFSWLPFPDSARFRVLGLYWFAENNPKLWRMPVGQFETLPKGVQRQCKLPAGGRILLKSDTTKLGLKVLPLNKGAFKGFDVYVNGSFLRSGVVEEPNVEVELVLFKDLDKQEKEIVIYLPYHQSVLIKAVGVDEDAKFSTPDHKYAKPLPVVFYGSSVCQGSGGLKPGMSYEAIVCRKLNLDFINLGFGGAGKAEDKVVALVNSIPACCYVFDLGKSYGMQDSTAFKKMLQTIRQSHPGVPLVCMTPITSALEVHSQGYSNRSVHTRTVMRDAANEFIKSGEKGVYLLEGTELLGFEDHDGLSKDGVHPTDYGFSLIANKLLPTVKQALGL